MWAPTSEIDEWRSSEAGHRWATLAVAWLSRPGPRTSSAGGTGTGRPTRWARTSSGRRSGRSAARCCASSPRSSRAARRTAPPCASGWRGGGRTGPRPCSTTPSRRCCARPSGSGSPVAGPCPRPAAPSSSRPAYWLVKADRPHPRHPVECALRPRPATVATDLRRGERRAPEPGPLGRDVAAAMSPHLPAPVDHVLVQADLTAVAPGPLVGGLGVVHAPRRRRRVPRRRHGLPLHPRVGAPRPRRRLDRGRVIDTVRRSSRTPVPQPLEYLVSDVARRHGQTRIGGAAAYVRSDDHGVLDTMLASRDLARSSCGGSPRRSRVVGRPRRAFDLLREHGFAPVHEGPRRHVVHAEAPVVEPAAGGGDPVPSSPPSTTTRRAASSSRCGLPRRRRRPPRRARARAHQAASLPPDPVVTLALLRDAVAERPRRLDRAGPTRSKHRRPATCSTHGHGSTAAGSGPRTTQGRERAPSG